MGLAEVHQTLTVNGLRERVGLRCDGGMRSGRDILVRPRARAHRCAALRCFERCRSGRSGMDNVPSRIARVLPN